METVTATTTAFVTAPLPMKVKRERKTRGNLPKKMGEVPMPTARLKDTREKIKEVKEQKEED